MVNWQNYHACSWDFLHICSVWTGRKTPLEETQRNALRHMCESKSILNVLAEICVLSSLLLSLYQIGWPLHMQCLTWQAHSQQALEEILREQLSKEIKRQVRAPPSSPEFCGTLEFL